MSHDQRCWSSACKSIAHSQLLVRQDLQTGGWVILYRGHNDENGAPFEEFCKGYYTRYYSRAEHWGFMLHVRRQVFGRSTTYPSEPFLTLQPCTGT